MLPKNGLCPASEAGNILRVRIVVFLQEKLDQQRDVFQALRQRRNANLNGTEAVEKILTEAPGEDFGAEVAISCGNQADIHLPDFR